MFGSIAKEHSFFENTLNAAHLDGSYINEYLLFVNILRYQHCEHPYDNKNVLENNGDYIWSSKDVNVTKRRKRGVMEDIVSAYSDIVTKG